MSEEATNPENDGTWSGLRKTIIGTLTTLVAGGGTWLGVTLFGGGSDEKSEEKTEQVQAAPVQPVINLNVDNSSQNNSTNSAKSGGTTTIIREKTVEKAPQEKPAKKSETEDAPW